MISGNKKELKIVSRSTFVSKQVWCLIAKVIWLRNKFCSTDRSDVDMSKHIDRLFICLCLPPPPPLIVVTIHLLISQTTNPPKLENNTC